MCLSISSLIVLGSGGQIWGLGKKDERTNLEPRRCRSDLAFYTDPSVRLPSSPDIAAAFPVSRHAAQTATVARDGAGGEKRTRAGGEGCAGGRV